MNLFEDTNPRELKDLLSEIHNRTTALPDFQRDFVWEPGATQELIVSIANNYPAGSILRVRDSKRLFSARQFEGAPSLGQHKHTFLVLDGQQRLTSLYQAFYGVGEHRYFLDLQKLINGLDFEETIFHVRATTKWARAHEDLKLQTKELLLPLAVLKGGSGGFHRWSRVVTHPLPPDERLNLSDAFDRLEEEWFDTIDDYQFPVVTLSDKTEPSALCTIFETLNRTGIKLSVFELLTARFWAYDINLRKLWDEVRSKHPIIEDFGVDPYYLLQAISLACRRAPSCKRSDVLNLDASDITAWWWRVVIGLELGLEILRDDCKVMLPKWIPYQTMMAPLAAVLACTNTPNTPKAGVHREHIKRWFWCSVFGQAYESAANGQAAKDVTELNRWLAGGLPPDSVADITFDPKALRDVTPRQRAIYRGVVCLVLCTGTGSRDFHTQATISGKLMVEQGIDDHHIFPASYLENKLDIKHTRIRDCILNRTLIDRTTNQIIGKRPPSDYMQEIKDTAGFPFESVLRSHLLPVGESSPFWTDDYEGFLTFRQQEIWREIKLVTGLTQASDLESDDGETV